jgi:hypothetical protein
VKIGIDTRFVMEGMIASQISAKKGKGGEVEEVELKTSRYDSHRVHAG